MENSIYAGLSRQSALQIQMDLIANNLANMNTPGYRNQNAIFTEYVAYNTARGTEEKDPLSLVMDYGQFQSTAPGPLQQTGNPLDIAIQGKGYFGVQTPEGVMFTRNGNFNVNANGEIVTGNGSLVASNGGGAISIPRDAGKVTVLEDGTISTDNGPVGQLMVVEFANEQDLEAQGNGLYKTSAAPIPSEKSRVIQGFLEGSNVQPILEMTRMIDVSRAYQNSQRILQSEHERQRTMIQRLTQSA